MVAKQPRSVNNTIVKHGAGSTALSEIVRSWLLLRLQYLLQGMRKEWISRVAVKKMDAFQVGSYDQVYSNTT